MKKAVVVGVVFLFAFGVRGQVAGRASLPGHGGVPAEVLKAKPCCSRRASNAGVRLELTGIYIDSSLLWLVFRGVNRSAIDFRAGRMRFVIRDRHALKRRALQELRLVPLVRQEETTVWADSAVTLYYGLTPRVPGKRQELVIEWAERNGDRRMLIRVAARDLLTARRL
jgi:hypothetical protein